MTVHAACRSSRKFALAAAYKHCCAGAVTDVCELLHQVMLLAVQARTGRGKSHACR